MDIINTIHKYLGETLMLVAVIGIILAVVGIFRKKALEKPEDIFGMVYAGLLDLQALLGLIQWVYIVIQVKSIPTLNFALHPILMIAAVVVVHASSRWRKLPVPIRHRAQLIAYAISLVLIVIGRMLFA